MATLTDEEKAKIIADTDAKDAGDVNKDGNEADDTTTDNDADVVNGDDQGDQDQDNEEKPQDQVQGDQGETQTPTFTKQFSNLKGDSWDTYGPELETAYDNSFKEALRLNEELEKTRKALTVLTATQTTDDGNANGQGTAPAAQPGTQSNVQLPPEVQQGLSYIQTMQRRDMDEAFNKFKEQYPQVTEQANFTKFQKMAAPIGNALMTEIGREPTYGELFDKMASYFGWEAGTAQAQRGQGLKESLGSSAPGTGQTRVNGNKSPITDAQVDTYLWFYPGKSRADVRKELEEALAA